MLLHGGFETILVYFFGFLAFVGIMIYIVVKGYFNPQWVDEDHQKHRAGFEVILVAFFLVGMAVSVYIFQ